MSIKHDGKEATKDLSKAFLTSRCNLYLTNQPSLAS